MRKTATLSNGVDGLVQPASGDALRYTIVLQNGGNGPATALHVTDLPSPKEELVYGSTATLQGGVVTSSNHPDDTNIAARFSSIALKVAATACYAYLTGELEAEELVNQGSAVLLGYTDLRGDPKARKKIEQRRRDSILTSAEPCRFARVFQVKRSDRGEKALINTYEDSELWVPARITNASTGPYSKVRIHAAVSRRPSPSLTVWR